jgi:hypothetical protein
MRDRFLVALVVVLVAGAAFRTMSRRHAAEHARQRQAIALIPRGVPSSNPAAGEQGGTTDPIPLRQLHAKPGPKTAVAPPGSMPRRQANAAATTTPVRRPALAQKNDLNPKPNANAEAQAEQEEEEMELEPLVPQEVARMALGFVGEDPDAEDLWFDAINDPNRSADERKDLIEDLNEEGFADPKHLTEDDVPLILNRLQLIEELAPDAADDVNAAAFAEAYKDLVNMLEKARGN